MAWDYDRYTKVILGLAACFGVILICISIWTLADPIMKYFHFTKLYDYRYEKPLFEGRMFIILSAIGIALGILLLAVMSLGLFLNLEGQLIRRVVSWGAGILLILNIAGFVSLCMQDDMMNRFKILEVMDRKIKDYHYYKEAMDFMDAIQWKLQCCGIYGPGDYNDPRSVSPIFGPPDSCPYPYPPIPPEGCIDLMLTYTTTRWNIFISMYILLTLFQVTAIASVCLLGYKGFKRTPTIEE